MTVSKDHVVSIEYTLTSNSGEVLDTSKGGEPLVYLHGAKNIIPGLEKELDGKSTGDEFKVTVAPDEAYGQRDERLINTVPKAELSSIPNLEVGMQLQAQMPQGMQILTVVEVTDDEVTLDGNHPLAGEILNFEVKVGEIRQATSEELEHGHVHGPGGHAH